MLAEACAALEAEFPTLDVRGIAGSYEQAFPALATLSPLTLLFLGSSVGNLNPAELDEFLARLTANLSGGDHVLLGIDLVKSAAVLEAAYDDAAGWTAAFTQNLFARMNRELGTALHLNAIEHVAYWNPTLSRIEIYARFRREMVIDLSEWGQRFRIARGEMVLVEISRKFEVDAMAAVTARHDLDRIETFTDPARAFALLLLRRRAHDRIGRRRRALHRALDAQRSRTLELVSALDDARLITQHSHIMSPLVWDLGHIATFEEQWIRRASGAPRDCDALERDRLYDPIVHPRAVRGGLTLGDRRACEEALAEVRARTMAFLDATAFPSDDPLLCEGYVFPMLAQHEAQHAETMLQAIQLMPDLVFEPSRRIDPPRARLVLPSREVWVAAGAFTMGTDDRSVAYDNERPAHEVWLDTFRIDVAPVTNADWLRFMNDGGYRRREVWTPEGWAWLREGTVAHPAQWRRLADGSWGECAFGRLEVLVPGRPVVHVSWFEAAAYARWAGGRLPTEAEWEKAAAWDHERGVPRRYPWGDAEPTPALANLDQRTFAPAEVGALPDGQSWVGCHQLIGDVWEWTASEFTPYPGFEPFPYPEYSAVHFGRGYKVLRGGSWATPAVAIRNTFRNWDLPQRRQLFAGLRCVRD